MTRFESVALFDVCNPKQWPTIAQDKFTESGYPVYGANGVIGFYSEFNHAEPTVLITCRGATCGEVNICSAHSYVTGNSMALDDLDELRVDYRYLARYLRFSGLKKSITGSAQPQITRQGLSSVTLLLPGLDEQKRIAAILDQAESLRAKRRAALEQVDTLAQAIFIEIFGDLASGSGHPNVVLGELLDIPLRNGVSPSSGGSVVSKVLTLSAITGSEYASECWKEGMYSALPSELQNVNSRDLLICRGNGNGDLVGKGYFPDESVADTYFPDTMIAARVNEELVSPAYLQFLWNSPVIRKQIAAKARTTNGTFKVNQGGIEAIEVCYPPLELQRKFSARLRKIEEQKRTFNSQQVEFDALFASLQHRAFRGEL